MTLVRIARGGLRRAGAASSPGVCGIPMVLIAAVVSTGNGSSESRKTIWGSAMGGANTVGSWPTRYASSGMDKTVTCACREAATAISSEGQCPVARKARCAFMASDTLWADCFSMASFCAISTEAVFLARCRFTQARMWARNIMRRVKSAVTSDTTSASSTPMASPLALRRLMTARRRMMAMASSNSAQLDLATTASTMMEPRMRNHWMQRRIQPIMLALYDDASLDNDNNIRQNRVTYSVTSSPIRSQLLRLSR
mmetsp:Transcript_48660/g.105576  ORF Transcript_48660/g.105576 Transcript_48660/m.105576 type:complete len:255 (+) Transcript_48660:370-1134(+)